LDLFLNYITNIIPKVKQKYIHKKSCSLGIGHGIAAGYFFFLGLRASANAIPKRKVIKPAK
jgi:hypothetical protein